MNLLPPTSRREFLSPDCLQREKIAFSFPSNVNRNAVFHHYSRFPACLLTLQILGHMCLRHHTLPFLMTECPLPMHVECHSFNMCIHTHTHTHTHTQAQRYTHIYTHAHRHTLTQYPLTHTCMYICTHIYTHAHTYTHSHINT